jgi:hypothetical protein
VARLEFNRVDIVLRIEKHGNPVAGIQISTDAPAPQLRIDRPIFLDWLHRELERPWEPPRHPQVLRRLTLEIAYRPLQALAWESSLRSTLGGTPIDGIIRVSPIIPRISQTTLTPPLRILICDAPDAPDVLSRIRKLFGDRMDEDVEHIYQAASVRMQDIEEPDLRVPLSWPGVPVWPMADVVQLSGKLGERPLSPSLHTFGSMGWISRVLDGWQTRALIVEADPEELPRARELAAGLVARGGPAVLVLNRGSPVDPIYAGLLRDRPLDHPSLTGSYDSLFGGMGREELVRVSNTAAAVLAIERSMPWQEDEIRGAVGRGRLPEEPLVLPELRKVLARSMASRQLRGFAGTASQWVYHEPDSTGMTSMIEGLRKIRGSLERATPTRRAHPSRRYVNGNLWRETKIGRLRVQPTSERLFVGELYHLRIDIGARNRSIPTYGASVFKEIPHSLGQQGVWVEIALSAVGCDIQGDTVQPLWIPETGPAEAIWFAVRPTLLPVTVLRYTIYYRQNVVQTFRMGALTQAVSGAVQHSASSAAQLLARALNVPVRATRGRTQLTRLEYAAATVETLSDLPAREIAIVANHVAEARVITVKGAEFHFSGTTGGVDTLSTDARNELFDGSVVKVDLQDPRTWTYRYRDPALNEAVLRSILPTLALKGWRLYDDAFAKNDRDVFEKDLEQCDLKIVVAHTLLDDVVPWALMYDRLYTDEVAPGRRNEVCLAGLPNERGELPFTSCAQSASCVLLKDPLLLPQNVACPLRFWGFRHLIDLPTFQQSSSPRNVANVRPQALPPALGAPAQSPLMLKLAAVVNASLLNANTHLADLRTLHTLQGESVSWAQLEDDPQRVLSALSDPDLNLAYFYCHARGGQADPHRTRPPILEFTRGAQTARYSSDRLQIHWKRRPLVILNGCSTAAFSPDALSPFVKKLTRDCEAGSVIGTEIPVHEMLAADFACRLLQRVLDGEEVGVALRTVRRALLARHNPLGLAYTLYGATEFQVAGG